MKRSGINRAYFDALRCFSHHHWALPPFPRWDITDFGLGDFNHRGLTLINLASNPEYCEKLMYAKRGQTTPCHAHAKKKEDIICRAGELAIVLWPAKPASSAMLPPTLTLNIDGEHQTVPTGQKLIIAPGSRVTLVPGIWHEFYPTSEECIIGEVSTANDDLHDNFFLDPDIGRFPGIEEDEPAAVRLVHE
ncbi:MAG: D-lyxose/D-mannose family sugar isomerase [Verrucomicrobiota bacterium]